MRLSKRQRGMLVERVTRSVTEFHARHALTLAGPLHKHCLLWAFFTIVELRKLKIRAILQAGTAYWPICTPETDDGVSPTEFGFGFTAPEPPEYLWVEPDQLPTGARYWADRHAIDIANSYLQSMIIGEPLVIRLTQE